jgi:hypothetical protein
MSIRPTELKESVYESEDSDMTESEIKTEEVKKNYLFMILFIAIDYVITGVIIVHESNIFNSEADINYLFLIIYGACLTAFFLFIIISLLFYKVCLSKIIKYLYIIILGAYFVYLLVLKIIYFVNHFDDVIALDWVFLVLLLLTIAPRLFFFCYIDAYIIALVQKYEYQKEEDHEDLKQALENKMEMERGDNTNWSKTSLPKEPKRTSD